MNEYDWRHTYIRKNHLIVCQQICETLEDIGHERHCTVWYAVAFTMQYVHTITNVPADFSKLPTSLNSKRKIF